MTINDAIGSTITLTIIRENEFGYFLTDGEEDILLHKNEATREYAIDEEVEVFLYTDSYNRITATDTIPAITTETYDWAEVIDVDRHIGAFLNIGIQKDILLGKDDLPKMPNVWPQQGDLVYTTLRVSNNNRIYARPATDTVFKSMMTLATKNDYNKSIQGRIFRTSKVGSWLYTTEGFFGFIHNSERGDEPRVGQKVIGRIIEVHSNGTVNVSLLPRVEESLDEDAKKILDYMTSRNGAMPYSDKSQPEDIYDRFEMSKSSFKRALGRLMKDKQIYQSKGWTYFKTDDEDKN